MDQFVLLFHAPIPEAPLSFSPEQLAAIESSWQNYIGGIAAQGKFLGTQRLGFDRDFISLSSESTSAAPFSTIGFLTVKAADLAEAKLMASTCPVLQMGGMVEVRSVVPFEM